MMVCEGFVIFKQIITMDEVLNVALEQVCNLIGRGGCK